MNVAAIDKYLARHARPEAARADSVAGAFDRVVVVPACDESPAFADALAELAATDGQRVACVVVVNANDAAPARTHARNAALLEDLAARAPEDPVRFVAVDRASPGARLPRGEGVGLARRIGCDLALALWRRGRVASPWIHSTDADAVLPSGYFAEVDGTGDDAVLTTYPFLHEPEGDAPERAAVLDYEAGLRYYVLGLAWSGSPYAYHTVGSALAVRADAYAAVRGIPRREAGEDFYLAHKVAKLGRVLRAGGDPIRLSGRASARVPFGTGPAVARIAATRRRGEPHRVYHPDTFARLRAFLAALDRAAAGDGTLAIDDAELAAAAATLGAADAIADARARTASPDAARRRMHTWFDGFRTLKLVHALRDGGLAPVPLAEAFGAAPFRAATGTADAPAGAALLARERAFTRGLGAGLAACTGRRHVLV